MIQQPYSPPAPWQAGKQPRPRVKQGVGATGLQTASWWAPACPNESGRQPAGTAGQVPHRPLGAERISGASTLWAQCLLPCPQTATRQHRRRRPMCILAGGAGWTGVTPCAAMLPGGHSQAGPRGICKAQQGFIPVGSQAGRQQLGTGHPEGLGTVPGNSACQWEVIKTWTATWR